jgi:hypothetical protein
METAGSSETLVTIRLDVFISEQTVIFKITPVGASDLTELDTPVYRFNVESFAEFL